MTRFIVSRLLQAIPALLMVSVFVFLLITLLPGDPAQVILGEDAPPEAVDALRQELGLDQPLVVRYFDWLGGALTGDLGVSSRSQTPVVELVLNRLPVTLTLTVLATLVTVVIGVPLGIWAAARRGRGPDRAVLAGSLVGVSVPGFFVGVLLILVFSVKLGWFPAVASTAISDNFWSGLSGFLLPALSLGLLYMAVIARMSRTSVLDVLDEEHVTVARSKGIGEKTVLLKNVMRPATIPVLTVVGINFGHLIGGSVVTEKVFSLPGVGSLIVNSIETRDYAVVQGSILIVSALFLLTNIIVDVLYAIVDPRVRVS